MWCGYWPQSAGNCLWTRCYGIHLQWAPFECYDWLALDKYTKLYDVILIQVTFVGEGAVDTGGPRREFLRLLVTRVTSSPYFHSGSDGSFFACNTTGYKVSGCGFLPGSEFFFVCVGMAWMSVLFANWFSLRTGQPLQSIGNVCSNFCCTGWSWLSTVPSCCVYVLMYRGLVTRLHSHYKHSRPCLEKRCIKGKYC